MFGVGDKIVLVVNNPLDKTYYNDLYVHRTYTVRMNDTRRTDGYIGIEGTTVLYDSRRFVPLTEFRRMKIEEICTRLVTE
jgi:hypothetical protein